MSCRGPLLICLQLSLFFRHSSPDVAAGEAFAAVPAHAWRRRMAFGARACGVRCTCVQRMGCVCAAYGVSFIPKSNKSGHNA